MENIQKAILDDLPAQARYLSFLLKPGADPRPVLQQLALQSDGRTIVVGLGQSLLLALDAKVPGMTGAPVFSGAGIDIPSTPMALWLWVRGEDRGELVQRCHGLLDLLTPAFSLVLDIDAFLYAGGRDLSGYEDGTENPSGQAARDVAFVQSDQPGLCGSSFVAVQQWFHDLDGFKALPQSEQDDTIGRRLSDNEEFESAPLSAHVKRTAQESYTPQAFMLRRSMPWRGELGEGLVFVAFGADFSAFEAQMRRMVGLDDGIADALFRFTSPRNSCYFWCPPMKEGGLDLSVLGIE